VLQDRKAFVSLLRRALMMWRRCLQVPLKIEDFNRVGSRVPLLGNLSPHGPFHMSDLDAIGGGSIDDDDEEEEEEEEEEGGG
jgi:hypothetical protein